MEEWGQEEWGQPPLITHTRRRHVSKDTVGEGHLYQGKYKSFIYQQDTHFLTLVRYVERNAKQASLARKAESWQWSSAWLRQHGTPKQKKLLSSWPLKVPNNYFAWLNNPQTKKEEKAIELATQKASPFGGRGWMSKIVKKHHLA